MSWIRLAAVAGRYGYDEMATPVFEATEVFARTLGETSDVVTKEMYSFETKGGDSVTLRPENTAGVARADHFQRSAAEPAAALFLRRPDVPPRAAAEGPAAPVPPDRHRAGRRRPSARRCRDDRGRRRRAGCARRAGTDNAGAEHARRHRKPRRPTATGWSAISPATGTIFRKTAAAGWTSTRCASWIPRMPATARSWPMRRSSATR